MPRATAPGEPRPNKSSVPHPFPSIAKGCERGRAPILLSIPNPKTGPAATICISSQVGCAVNCQFASPQARPARNLTAGEIAGQVWPSSTSSVEMGRDRVNLVFMGMGEPFLNYDSFMAAVRLLVSEVGLSPRRMTVSTSGIVPGIERFAPEAPIRPKLAISLNAPNDAFAKRSCRSIASGRSRRHGRGARVPLRPRERITFEYVLLVGVNDRPEHAAEVARLFRRSGLPAKVNLIAWNGRASTMPRPTGGRRRIPAGADRCEGIPAHICKPRGRDIYAACGQLKRTMEAISMRERKRPDLPLLVWRHGGCGFTLPQSGPLYADCPLSSLWFARCLVVIVIWDRGFLLCSCPTNVVARPPPVILICPGGRSEVVRHAGGLIAILVIWQSRFCGCCTGPPYLSIMAWVRQPGWCASPIGGRLRALPGRETAVGIVLVISQRPGFLLGLALRAQWQGRRSNSPIWSKFASSA